MSIHRKDNWRMIRDEETGDYELSCTGANFDEQEKSITLKCANQNMTGDVLVDVKAKSGALTQESFETYSPSVTSSSQITAQFLDGNKLRMTLSPSETSKNIYHSNVISSDGWIDNNVVGNKYFTIKASFSDYGNVPIYFSHSYETISGVTGSINSGREINVVNERNVDFIIIKHKPKGGSEAYHNYIDYRNAGETTIHTISNPWDTSDIGGGIFYRKDSGWVYRQDYSTVSNVIGNGNIDYLRVRCNSGGTFICEEVTMILGDTSVN